ncbi:MAG: hypothetical protein JNJ59_25320 [Deltaproteobacteria bacterium]|jgi:hypothetical protein|nr:hypothetical protein [Deltaproteobacteria bacterium]
MLTRRSLLTLFSLLFVVVAGGAGCKAIKRMLPTTTVNKADEGTPEWLVLKGIEAGIAGKKEGTEAGWKIIRPWLHSSLTELRTSEDNFLNMNFPAFCRKVHLFIPKDGSLSYELDYYDSDVGDEEKERRVFIVNTASENPSPFRIARDPKANNEWRIKNIP